MINCKYNKQQSGNKSQETQKKLASVYDSVYITTTIKNQDKTWEIIMDDFIEQIELLKRKKADLMEQISRVDKAISVLRGEVITPRTPQKKQGGKKKEVFACMKETIEIFNQNDYLSKKDILRIMESKGLKQANTLRGKNSLNTTLGRLFDRGALAKTETNTYYKTPHWNNGGGKDRIRTRRLKSLSASPAPESISSAAERMLREHESAAHYTQIMKMLEAEGYEIGGKDPRANMTAHLSNNKKIRGVGNGYYELREWNE